MGLFSKLRRKKSEALPLPNTPDSDIKPSSIEDITSKDIIAEKKTGTPSLSDLDELEKSFNKNLETLTPKQQPEKRVLKQPSLISNKEKQPEIIVVTRKKRPKKSGLEKHVKHVLGRSSKKAPKKPLKAGLKKKTGKTKKDKNIQEINKLLNQIILEQRRFIKSLRMPEKKNMKNIDVSVKNKILKIEKLLKTQSYNITRSNITDKSRLLKTLKLIEKKQQVLEDYIRKDILKHIKNLSTSLEAKWGVLINNEKQRLLVILENIKKEKQQLVEQQLKTEKAVNNLKSMEERLNNKQRLIDAKEERLSKILKHLKEEQKKLNLTDQKIQISIDNLAKQQARATGILKKAESIEKKEKLLNEKEKLLNNKERVLSKQRLLIEKKVQRDESLKQLIDIEEKALDEESKVIESEAFKKYIEERSEDLKHSIQPETLTPKPIMLVSKNNNYIKLLKDIEALKQQLISNPNEVLRKLKNLKKSLKNINLSDKELEHLHQEFTELYVDAHLRALSTLS